jgi:hypothetical protein
MVFPSKDRRRCQRGLVGRLVPLELAIESVGVGRAMLEVSARGGEVASGTIIENRDLLRYSNAYLARTSR